MNKILWSMRYKKILDFHIRHIKELFFIPNKVNEYKFVIRISFRTLKQFIAYKKLIDVCI